MEVWFWIQHGSILSPATNSKILIFLLGQLTQQVLLCSVSKKSCAQEVPFCILKTLLAFIQQALYSIQKSLLYCIFKVILYFVFKVQLYSTLKVLPSSILKDLCSMLEVLLLKVLCSIPIQSFSIQNYTCFSIPYLTFFLLMLYRKSFCILY